MVDWSKKVLSNDHSSDAEIGGMNLSIDMVVVVAGVILAILYRNRDKVTGAVRLPSWIWKGIGIFLILMLLRNVPDVVKFFTSEADQWWIIIYDNAVKWAAGLRHFFKIMTGGG